MPVERDEDSPVEVSRKPSRHAQEAFEIEFFEGLLRRDPRETTVIELLGGLYTRAGRLTDGLRMDRKLVRLTPENPTAHYNLACSLALKGRKKEAVEALRVALAKGYDDIAWLLRDADLKELQDYGPFESLMDELETPE